MGEDDGGRLQIRGDVCIVSCGAVLLLAVTVMMEETKMCVRRC